MRLTTVSLALVLVAGLRVYDDDPMALPSR